MSGMPELRTVFHAIRNWLNGTDPSFSTIHHYWYALSAVQVTLLIHVALYGLSEPERLQNRAFLALGIAAIVVAILVIIFTRWINAARINRLRLTLQKVDWIVFVVMAGLLLVMGLELRPEWFYAHLALSLALTFSLISWTLLPLPSYHKVALVVLALGIAAVIVVRINGLSVYPGIHVTDEGWTLSWAVDYLKTGSLGQRILLYAPYAYPAISYFYIPLALWLQVVGTGLWEARLFIWLLTVLVILFTARAAWNWYGKGSAFCTAAALFCSPLLASAVRIRHDIGLALAFSASLWAYTEAVKRNRLSLHFLAGLLMGWGAFAHLNIIYLGVAVVGGLYGPRYLNRLRSRQYWPETSLLLYITGAILAAGMVFVVQIAPYLDQVLTVSSLTLSSSESLVSIFLKHIANIGEISKIEFVLVVLGLIAALFRQRSEDWSLVSVLVLSHIFLMFIMPSEYYLIPLVPFYGLAAGALFGTGFHRRTNSPPQYRNIRLAILMLLPLLGTNLKLPLNYLFERGPIKGEVPTAAQWIREHVSLDKQIVGENFYYLWLYEYPYVSAQLPLFIEPKKRTNPAYNLEVWASLQPDVFIVDRTLATYWTLDFVVHSDYLSQHNYRRAAEFNDGKIAIYVKSP